MDPQGSPSATPSPAMAGTNVWQYSFFAEPKPNAWHRFVVPMAVDMNGGFQNYPRAENHHGDNYCYLSLADLPTALPAAKTMQLKLTLYTEISLFKT